MEVLARKCRRVFPKIRDSFKQTFTTEVADEKHSHELFLRLSNMNGYCPHNCWLHILDLSYRVYPYIPCIYNYISPSVKASTVGYCLACSKCIVLWEINPGSENSNLRFIGLMPYAFWDLGIALCSVYVCVCVCVCVLLFTCACVYEQPVGHNLLVLSIQLRE